MHTSALQNGPVHDQKVKYVLQWSGENACAPTFVSTSFRGTLHHLQWAAFAVHISCNEGVSCLLAALWQKPASSASYQRRPTCTPHRVRLLGSSGALVLFVCVVADIVVEVVAVLAVLWCWIIMILLWWCCCWCLLGCLWLGVAWCSHILLVDPRLW